VPKNLSSFVYVVKMSICSVENMILKFDVVMYNFYFYFYVIFKFTLKI